MATPAVMDGDAPGPVSRFGPFTLDAGRAELLRNGLAVALRPKTFALLSYLSGRPGRVIPKGELLAAVWPGVVVNDESLSQCVRELRAALGADGQGLIKTVPRRGYLFDARPEPVAPLPAGTGAHLTAGRWKRSAMAGFVLVVALLIVLMVWLASAPPREQAPGSMDDALKARRSVAVLPFGDTGDGRVGEALSTGIVTALAKVPDTLVIAGATPGAAPTRADLRRSGREPTPRHRLTGSVQRDGDRVRVHAQLDSGEDGAVSWSELFEHVGPPDEAWQRDLVLRVAHGVDWRMGTATAERRPSGRRDPVDELIRGQNLLRHAARYDELVRARKHFELLTAAWPGSAAAWTGLAQSYVSELEAAWNLGLGSVALAEQAIARARAANPDYLPVQYVSASLLAVRGDLAGALRMYEAVSAANPSDPWAQARIAAMKLRLGQFTQVQVHTGVALRLGALEPSLVAFSQLQAGLSEYYLGRDASAYEHLRQSVAAGPSPTQVEALLMLASLDALNGRGQEARGWSSEVLRLRPRFAVGAWREWTAPVHPQLQPLRDRFLEGLAKAGLPE